MPEPTDSLPRLDLASSDTAEETREALRALVPSAFDEQGKLDTAKLRECLGELAEGRKDRYNLSWAGKADAQRALQILSTGTLQPIRGESQDFDATQNAIIEGDNLEVLKLLQKSYHGKVKMIYIDPPYNTGNDFIYPDNFREGLQTYLEYTGQAKKKVRETEENLNRAGRVHSNWLNMMYPRLALARNLLREDGVIFVSIDDHEVHNLRMLMDEVFGEENFVAAFIWKRRQVPDSRNLNGVSPDHEFVLAFTRGTAVFVGKSIDESKYSNTDDDPRGPWMSDNLTGLATATQRPNLHYIVENPLTGLKYPPHSGRGWGFSPEKMSQFIADKRILWPKSPEGRPRIKRFLAEVRERTTGFSSVLSVGFTTDGTRQTTELFGAKIFDFPKPVGLMRTLAEQCCEPGDIVLDFFAGSGTTAQAVMELNQEDGGNRRFILVQLPEPLDPPITLDGGTKLKTISGICRERVLRAARKIAAKGEGKLDLDDSKPDLGFRAFRLTGSNFKLWEDKSEGNPDKLAEQLKLYADNILPDRDPEAILFEILLKSGIELSAPIETIEVKGQPVFRIDGGRLLAYLQDPVAEDVLRALIERGAEKIVCLDHAFRGNDALKANIAQQVKQHNAHHPDKRVDFRTI